jgi:hypothetical protein
LLFTQAACAPSENPSQSKESFTQRRLAVEDCVPVVLAVLALFRNHHPLLLLPLLPEKAVDCQSTGCL